jgi:hypothetical protein
MLAKQEVCDITMFTELQHDVICEAGGRLSTDGATKENFGNGVEKWLIERRCVFLLHLFLNVSRKCAK